MKNYLRKIIALALVSAITLCGINFGGIQAKAEEISVIDISQVPVKIKINSDITDNNGNIIWDGKTTLQPEIKKIYVNTSAVDLSNFDITYNMPDSKHLTITVIGKNNYSGSQSFTYNVVSSNSDTVEDSNGIGVISKFMIINGSRDLGIDPVSGNLYFEPESAYSFVGIENYKVYSTENGKEHIKKFMKTLNNLNILVKDPNKNNVTFSSDNKKIFTIKNNKKMVLKHPGVANLIITSKLDQNMKNSIKVVYLPTPVNKKGGYAGFKNSAMKLKIKKNYIYIKFKSNFHDENLVYYTFFKNGGKTKKYESKPGSNIIKIKIKKNKTIKLKDPSFYLDKKVIGYKVEPYVYFFDIFQKYANLTPKQIKKMKKGKWYNINKFLKE